MLILALLALAPPDFAARVDRIAQEAVRSGTTAGLAVAVMDRGRTLVAKGYGYANLELHAEVRPETVFRIGSITKQFTAAAVLQLVEQGKLRLDEGVVVLRNTEGPLVVTIAERIARAALGIREPAGQPVPLELGRRCEGEYGPDKARLSLEWRDGKLFVRRGKEEPVELLRDGDAVFAPTTCGIAATAARSASATASAGPTTCHGRRNASWSRRDSRRNYTWCARCDVRSCKGG